MADAEPQYESTKRLQQLRVVHLALWAGCLMFLGVAILVRLGDPVNPNQSLLTTIALGYALLVLILSLIVPALIVGQRLRKMKTDHGGLGVDAGDAVPALIDLYWTQKIVSFSLLEGGIFFLLIAYLVEGQHAALLVAGSFLLGFLVEHPTRGRMEEWVERQTRRTHESAGD